MTSARSRGPPVGNFATLRDQPGAHTLTSSPPPNLRYSDYLKVPELLDLQHCLADPPAHDELQFIIVHQVYELWFKLVKHELVSAREKLDEASDQGFHRALHFLRRVDSIFDVLVPQIHVLESMRPADFLKFRAYLNPASGFGSVQFREVECLMGLKDKKLADLAKTDPRHGELLKRLDEPSLCDAFYGALAKRGLDVTVPEGRDEAATATTHATLRALYIDPDSQPLVYALCETLLDLDEKLVLWRRHHVMMVERQIGDKPGTGRGITGELDGIRYLAKTLDKRALPDLWRVRSLLPD